MTAAPAKQVFEIRKYPNRRFYDVTRSRHVTLNDLFDLVRHGHEIVVRDSRSGADITNVVLTLIILEHDPPKLDLFPASLLHQAIQSNQEMIRQFIDRYFAQAVDAFARSREQFDEFLRRSGFSALAPSAPFDWVRMLIPGVGRAAASAPPDTGVNVPASADGDSARDLRQELDALRREVQSLRADRGSGSASTGRKRTTRHRKA